jgi:hypothetical protein
MGEDAHLQRLFGKMRLGGVCNSYRKIWNITRVGSDVPRGLFFTNCKTSIYLLKGFLVIFSFSVQLLEMYS